MNVRFGNLTIAQFEKKTSVELTHGDYHWMNEHRQDSTAINDPNKFHIYDLPLLIVAGEKCGPELVKRLTSGGYEFKRHFAVETVD